MINPVYMFSFEITLADFFLVFSVELILFAFIMNKLDIKENFGNILISNLLEIGLLSLFISWVPIYLSNSFKTLILFSVLMLLLGSVVTTYIFQKELMFSRKESFNLAFQLNIVSSAVFLVIKNLFIPEDSNLYFLASNKIERLNFFNSILSLNGITGFIIILIGLIMLILKLNNKIIVGNITKS
jgi:hypothetical protein